MAARIYQQRNNVQELTKFQEIEVQKVAEAILSIYTLRIQVGTFFGTVNLSALSIAVTVKQAGIFFFAASVMWLFILIDRIAVQTLARYYFRAFQLQQLFSPDEITFLTIAVLKGWPRQIRKIMKQPKDTQRQMVHKLGRRTTSMFGFWIPLVGSIIEIAAGVILWLYLNWNLF